MNDTPGSAGAPAQPGARRTGTSPTIGVIFDCDGLLLDTEHLWQIAERTLHEELGGTWDDSIHQHTHGKGIEDSAAILADLAGAPLPRVEGAQRLLSCFEEIIEQHEISLMPGALALLDSLRTVPLAVASNSPIALVDQMLRRSGIRDLFGAVTGAGGDLRPKPAPDVYLAVCRQLNLIPHQVHILEDSKTGLQAARSAGAAATAVFPGPQLLDGIRQVMALTDLAPADLGVLTTDQT